MFSLCFNLILFTLLVVVAIVFTTIGMSGLVTTLSENPEQLNELGPPVWVGVAVIAVLHAIALLVIGAGIIRRGFKMAILPLVFGGILCLLTIFAMKKVLL